MKPVVEAGLKARLGADVTIWLAEPIFISHKKENYESEYGEPDEDGCVDVKLKWTEINVFKIKFIVTLNNLFIATYTLGTYVTTEDKEETHRDCPGDVRLASVVEYAGPPEFAINDSEHQEFLAAVTPKLPYDRVVEDIKV